MICPLQFIIISSKTKLVVSMWSQVVKGKEVKMTKRKEKTMEEEAETDKGKNNR